MKYSGIPRPSLCNFCPPPPWARFSPRMPGSRNSRETHWHCLATCATGSKTRHSPDEITVRFHHRLVAIHPFPNGNGRHARLIADVLVTKLGRPAFSWGSANLVKRAKHGPNIWKPYERRIKATSGRCWSSLVHESNLPSDVDSPGRSAAGCPILAEQVWDSTPATSRSFIEKTTGIRRPRSALQQPCAAR